MVVPMEWLLFSGMWQVWLAVSWMSSFIRVLVGTWFSVSLSRMSSTGSHGSWDIMTSTGSMVDQFGMTSPWFRHPGFRLLVFAELPFVLQATPHWECGWMGNWMGSSSRFSLWAPIPVNQGGCVEEDIGYRSQGCLFQEQGQMSGLRFDEWGSGCLFVYFQVWTSVHRLVGYFYKVLHSAISLFQPSI